MASTASAASTTDSLRAYLSQLTPAARAMLLRELECGSYAGELTAGLGRVIEELRNQLRGSGHSADRIDGAERRLFFPLEPFLVDEELPRKLTGRIQRSSLAPIWKLLSDVALPRQTAAYVADLADALAAEDDAAAALATAEFQKSVLRVMDEALDALEADPKARTHLAAHFGSERVVDDLADVAAILRAQRTLASFANYLPVRIDDLGDRDLANLEALFRQPVLSRPDVLPYALALTLSRLTYPEQLLRLVPRAGQGAGRAPDEASSFAFAIDLVIGEIAMAVTRLESALQGRRKSEALSEIRKFGRLLRGLNDAIELPAHTSWSRWLDLVRADFAVLIRRRIDALPGRILRVLRPRTAAESLAAASIDSDEVADIEASLEILSACRALAREMALDDVVERLDEELESCLDTATPYLLMSLPQSDPRHRPYLLSQLDAAVRFAGQRSGKRYAELLARMATAVAQAESRVQ